MTKLPAEADLYGQVHPKETADMISRKLKDLEVELAKIRTEQKTTYEEAKIKCPELLTSDFKLMFLRCEVFNTDLAALRLVKYWEKRLEIFGPDRAFLPLTQDKALKDDATALSMGFMRVVPARDPSGRAILHIDPSFQDGSKYERESMCRSLWYMLHAVLEDEETQKKGVIFTVYPHRAKFSQFDRTLAKMNMESIKGCIPVRMSGIHICHPPSFFQIIFPIFKIFMGERLRKRVRVHGGSESHVLDRLTGFGLTKDKLPSDLGGKLVLDHEGWLDERKSKQK